MLCAYDPVWAFQFSAPVTRANELVRLAELLSLESLSLTSFTDYLAAQSAIAGAIAGSDEDVCAVGALVMWTREDPLGRMLVGYLDVSEEDGEVERTIAEQEREQDRIEQEREDGELREPREEAPSPDVVARFSHDAWDSFIETLSNPRQERLARLLRARKNVVLYGPPGTGKTVLSTRLGVAWSRWQQDEHHDAPSIEQVTRPMVMRSSSRGFALSPSAPVSSSSAMGCSSSSPSAPSALRSANFSCLSTSLTAAMSPGFSVN